MISNNAYTMWFSFCQLKRSVQFQHLIHCRRCARLISTNRLAVGDRVVTVENSVQSFGEYFDETVAVVERHVHRTQTNSQHVRFSLVQLQCTRHTCTHTERERERERLFILFLSIMPLSAINNSILLVLEFRRQ